MSAPPYMKLWIADYLADTTHLTRDEHGAYLLLLMALWRAGGKLPRGADKLAKIAKCTAAEWEIVGPVVMEFFTVTGGSIKQKRATKEIAKYQGVVKGSKKGGAASAAKRANKNNDEEATDVEKRLRLISTNQNQNQNQKELPLPETKVTTEPSVSADRASQKAARLSADWQPSADNIAYAVTQGFSPADVDLIAEDFRDYWWAKGGKDAAKLDWSATWRRWIREQTKRRPSFNAPRKQVDWC